MHRLSWKWRPKPTTENKCIAIIGHLPAGSSVTINTLAKFEKTFGYIKSFPYLCTIKGYNLNLSIYLPGQGAHILSLLALSAPPRDNLRVVPFSFSYQLNLEDDIVRRRHRNKCIAIITRNLRLTLLKMNPSKIYVFTRVKFSKKIKQK